MTVCPPFSIHRRIELGDPRHGRGRGRPSGVSSSCTQEGEGGIEADRDRSVVVRSLPNDRSKPGLRKSLAARRRWRRHGSGDTRVRAKEQPEAVKRAEQGSACREGREGGREGAGQCSGFKGKVSPRNAAASRQQAGLNTGQHKLRRSWRWDMAWPHGAEMEEWGGVKGQWAAHFRGTSAHPSTLALGCDRPTAGKARSIGCKRRGRRRGSSFACRSPAPNKRTHG